MDTQLQGFFDLSWSLTVGIESDLLWMPNAPDPCFVFCAPTSEPIQHLDTLRSGVIVQIWPRTPPLRGMRKLARDEDSAKTRKRRYY
jgi:hypothetical protein